MDGETLYEAIYLGHWNFEHCLWVRNGDLLLVEKILVRRHCVPYFQHLHRVSSSHGVYILVCANVGFSASASSPGSLASRSPL